ncbi:MAG: hypothetical protein K2N95_08325 [Lachnospiraceae bacterium]|nr:hypothetical protein [Lachnospiraceae bacterium]
MTIQYSPRDLIEKIAGNNYSYTYSSVKKVTVADANVEKLQDKAEAFKKKVKTLNRYTSGSISKDLLAGQVEDLVKTYNDMKSSASTVTDKDVQKQISKLEKLFSDNEKNLKKIGITNVNGKYSFDSDTFEDATDKAVNTLFVGYDSFIGKANKIMRNMEETTDDAQYVVSEYKINHTQTYKDTDIAQAASTTLAGQAASSIKAYNSIVQSGNGIPANFQDSMKILLTNFAKTVYRTEGTTDNETIDKLNQLCLDHEEELAKLGLTFSSDKKSMEYHPETIDMTSSDFQNTLNDLFGENATFGNTVSEYCKNIFNDIVQPDKIGVSILDQLV